MASTKDEITAIAIEHGYTGKKPDSIAKAIDALADTLAGEDVTGSRSIAGAVKALAPYIGSGGGGGSLGSMQYTAGSTNEVPSVGMEHSTNPLDIASLYVGSQQVISDGSVYHVAAGSSVRYSIYAETNDYNIAAYVIKFDAETSLLTSVAPWDGEYEHECVTVHRPFGGDAYNIYISMTVPELDYDDNERILFYVSYND